MSSGSPEAAAEASPAAGAAPGRRKKPTRLQAAQAKLAKARQQLIGLRVQLATKEHALATAKDATREKRQEAVNAHENKIAAKEKQIEALEQEEKDAETAADAMKEKAAAKARRAAEAAAITAHMSDKGIKLLVRLRLEEQKRMDDRSNKNESVWELISSRFNAAVDRKELPESDRREVKSLMSKYSREDGQFKQFCRKIQRMKTSGAPREDVGACCTHCVVSGAADPTLCPRLRCGAQLRHWREQQDGGDCNLHGI